jgi:hypothetical protein
MADTAVPAEPAVAPSDPQVHRWEPAKPAPAPAAAPVREIGGRENGMDPTRYGDWEKNGRCIDF